MINLLKVILNIISKKEIYGVVVILSVSYFLYKTISLLLEETINYGKNGYEKKKRRTIIKMFQNIAKYLTVIIALLSVLNLYGVNVKGMVAGLGITATLLGLALQDTFKDVINGICIMLENYFIVGDIVTYGTFTGEVVEFGLKSTKIKNVNGEVLIVANRNIMEIKNVSQEDQAITINIPLRYEEKVENVEKVIKEKILPKFDDIENVTKGSGKYLGVNSLEDSSVNYLVLFNCKRETQFQAKRDANAIILNELRKNNLEVPYPQLEVHNGK